MWVLLMVPVSAFAAVVAMAGPQRLAARSGMQDAADDLAAFTVAWRDGYQRPQGGLSAFPTADCETRDEGHREVLNDLELALEQATQDRDALNENDPNYTTDYAIAEQSVTEAEQALTQRTEEIDSWSQTCTLLYESLLSDLGRLGIASHSLEGFYSDSLTSAAGQTLLPCKSSEQIEIRDAVHVAIAADWHDASWAAAQVWPDGFRIATEAVARSAHVNPVGTANACQPGALEILDTQGQPVWASNPTAPARGLVQSVRRTPLGG